MKKKCRRIKLRNCIRKNTYRYYFEDDDILSIWNEIQQVFGKAREWMGVGLLNIENDRLIIRKSLNECSFTLIKKKNFSDSDEEILHNILGFKK